MSILFEIGNGQGACMCVELKQAVIGRWANYWYSSAFQLHKVNVGRVVISWRIRKFRSPITT